MFIGQFPLTKRGYDYFGARYYDARVGRWGSVEPLTEYIIIKLKNLKPINSRMKLAHPGAILREDILKEMNITISKAAESLQISRNQLSEIVNETTGITPAMALRFEQGFGIEAKFWLDLQTKYDLWNVRTGNKIPRIERVTA